MPSTLDVIRRSPALIKKLAMHDAAPPRKSTHAPQPQTLQPTTIQRAMLNPAALTSADVPQLQRMMGNDAVSRLLARSRAGQEGDGSLRVGASNDVHEREARRVADTVGGTNTVQRASSSESETIDAPEVGMEGGMVSRTAENSIQAARSGGKAVPDEIRLKVEQQTGDSYQDVRVHEGAHANAANDSLGARAFTQGRDIFLGRNQSPYNVQLMAHELTHTTQQGGGNAKSIADIQRDDDEEKIKKINKKISGSKAKKGLAKVGKGLLTGLDWLTTAPLRLLDHASVLDLHLKDFGNFVKTGKTRKERAGSNSSAMTYHKGTQRRRVGRTGLRALLSGVNVHTTGLDAILPWNGILNPFTAMGRGQRATEKVSKDQKKKIGNLRGQKQNIRNQMVENLNPTEVDNDMLGDEMSNDMSSEVSTNEHEGVNEDVIQEILETVVEDDKDDDV